MRIVLDASVFQHIATGMAKATVALYEACHVVDPNIRVNALHHRALMSGLPGWMEVRSNGAALPAVVWRQAVLPAVAASLKPDVVHFPWNGLVPAVLPCSPVVTTIFDVLPLAVPGFFRSERGELNYRRRIQRDILRSDVIITCSEYSKTEIMRHFRVRSEPEVIHIGVTLDNVACSVAPAGAGGYFLYVGGYHPRKGLEALVALFTSLYRDGKLSSRLLLTGQQRYYSESFREAVAAGVSIGAVEEMGYVSDATLAKLFSNATALVYPSKYEGFGLPPLEAMACGCPVITTRHTAIPEVCGDAVYYIDPDDRRDFARALVALETDAALRARLADRGRRQAAKFSWSVSAGKFLDALQTLHKVSRG